MNGLHAAREGPANNLSVIKATYNRQIYPDGQGAQTGNVRHPFLPAPSRMKLTVQDVFTDRKLVV
jgi:hypothetical protein